MKTIKKIMCFLLSVCMLGDMVGQECEDYTEKAALNLMKSIEPLPFRHTEHPESQWFPKAGLGLFIHWGIHSVAALDPSWGMLKNCWWFKPDRSVPPEMYYRLANEFNPDDYDPEKWALAAKNAGFQYVVLTTKHHDGYCLWPSKYGKWNTGVYMNGRDLIRPYVEACRKYGLKVGFYYSPRDWGNDEYYFPYLDYDYEKKWQVPKLLPEESQEKYEVFFDMVVGQLSELLTNYGKIDVLWFDGVEWPDVDTHADKMHAWLREVQPGMVVNPRWDTNDEEKSFGDFATEEYSWRKNMDEPPVEDGEWWEFCESWSGHWGYSPMKEFIPLADMVKLLVHARSYGGNYLINIGPAPDGTMRDGFYSECADLAKWMQKNKESVIGTNPVVDWKDKCKYPMTKAGENTYIHLLNDTVSKIKIAGIEKPSSAIFLETGETLSILGSKKNFTIDFNKEVSHPLDGVIKLEY